MRFDGRGPYKLCRQGTTNTVPLFPHSPILPLKAQLEAVMFSQFLTAAVLVYNPTATPTDREVRIGESAIWS